MTQKTDNRGWILPTPGDESEAGEWARLLVEAIDNHIEPDVTKALEKQTDVKHAENADNAKNAKQADTADEAKKVIFGDGTARELQINGSDKQGVVNFKTK